jgi:heme-degrading monooxygenase HmoA
MRQDQHSDTKRHIGFTKTPDPPYYVVIFTSQRSEGDCGYQAMAQTMLQLALKQPGCLGAESVRDTGGLGITVAYFADELAIHAWKHNSEHLVAQRLGKDRWYSHYEVRIAKIERAYSGPRSLAGIQNLSGVLASLQCRFALFCCRSRPRGLAILDNCTAGRLPDMRYSELREDVRFDQHSETLCTRGPAMFGG